MMLFLISVIVILLLVIALLLLGLYQKNTNAVYLKQERLDDVVAVVTGGTAGMGLELAVALAGRGARVVLAGPAHEARAALAAVRAACPSARVRTEPLDLACLRSTRAFAARLSRAEPTLHLLVNNAGIGGPTRTTADGLDYVMQINYYGHFLLTMLLLPLLRSSGTADWPARIVNVSSASYILGREYFEDTYLSTIPPFAYFNSKLYLMIFTRELAKRIKNHNVVVNSVDPGAVGTNIFLTFSMPTLMSKSVTFLFWSIFKTPWQGMQTALYASVDEETGKVSGELFKNCQFAKTSKIACNDEQATRLWNKSVRLVRLTDEELEKLL